MAEQIKCPDCNGLMSKIHTINSSNATYHEYLCKVCWKKKIVCVGLNKL